MRLYYLNIVNENEQYEWNITILVILDFMPRLGRH